MNRIVERKLAFPVHFFRSFPYKWFPSSQPLWPHHSWIKNPIKIRFKAWVDPGFLSSNQLFPIDFLKPILLVRKLRYWSVRLVWEMFSKVTSNIHGLIDQKIWVTCVLVSLFPDVQPINILNIFIKKSRLFVKILVDICIFYHTSHPASRYSWSSSWGIFSSSCSCFIFKSANWPLAVSSILSRINYFLCVATKVTLKLIVIYIILLNHRTLISSNISIPISGSLLGLNVPTIILPCRLTWSSFNLFRRSWYNGCLLFSFGLDWHLGCIAWWVMRWPWSCVCSHLICYSFCSLNTNAILSLPLASISSIEKLVLIFSLGPISCSAPTAPSSIFKTLSNIIYIRQIPHFAQDIFYICL